LLEFTFEFTKEFLGVKDLYVIVIPLIELVRSLSIA
jgi:hypothetical protein